MPQYITEIILSSIIAVSFFFFKYLLNKKDELDNIRFKSLKDSIDCSIIKNKYVHERIETLLLKHAHVVTCKNRECQISVGDLTVHS